MPWLVLCECDWFYRGNHIHDVSLRIQYEGVSEKRREKRDTHVYLHKALQTYAHKHIHTHTRHKKTHMAQTHTTHKQTITLPPPPPPPSHTHSHPRPPTHPENVKLEMKHSYFLSFFPRAEWWNGINSPARVTSLCLPWGRAAILKTSFRWWISKAVIKFLSWEVLVSPWRLRASLWFKERVKKKKESVKKKKERVKKKKRDDHFFSEGMKRNTSCAMETFDITRFISEWMR